MDLMNLSLARKDDYSSSNLHDLIKALIDIKISIFHDKYKWIRTPVSKFDFQAQSVMIKISRKVFIGF